MKSNEEKEKEKTAKWPGANNIATKSPNKADGKTLNLLFHPTLLVLCHSLSSGLLFCLLLLMCYFHAIFSMMILFFQHPSLMSIGMQDLKDFFPTISYLLRLTSKGLTGPL